MTSTQCNLFSVRFSGCIGRSACCRAVVFHLVLGIVLCLALYLCGRCWGESLFPTLVLCELDADASGTLFLLPLALYYAYALLLLLPSFLVRRLRDAGRAPALIILWYVSLLLLVWPLLWLYWAHILELPSAESAPSTQV